MEKTLRELIEQNCIPEIVEKCPDELLSLEVKNHALFPHYQLKGYFYSINFQEDLKKCKEHYNLAEDEGLFPFFFLKNVRGNVSIVLNAIRIPD